MGSVKEMQVLVLAAVLGAGGMGANIVSGRTDQDEERPEIELRPYRRDLEGTGSEAPARLDLVRDAGVSTGDLVAFDPVRRELTLRPEAHRRMLEAARPGDGFTIHVDGEKVADVMYVSSFMSRIVEGPVVNLQPLPGDETQPGVLHIERGYPGQLDHLGPDPLRDPRLLQALRALGLLRE